MSFLAVVRHAPIALGLLLVTSAAQAGRPVLLVHPTLVVLEGRTRGATVNLINRGDAAGTFTIDWVDYEMTPEGGLQVVSEPAPWSLQPHVRLSPRRVTLGPGEQQVIRVALRPREAVAPGERWSHLKVVTNAAVGAEAEVPPVGQTRGTTVTVVARPAMAIPVIWRTGRALAQASLETARWDRAADELVVEVGRQGAYSVRGTLQVVGPDGEPDGAPPSGIGGASAPVVIYPNLATKRVTLPLDARWRNAAALRTARLALLSEEDALGRRTVLATRPLAEMLP